MTATILSSLAPPDLTPRFSSTQDKIALADSLGKIVAVNDKWLIVAKHFGTPPERVGPGDNYLDLCRRASSFSSDAQEALTGIEAVIQGRLGSFKMDYSDERVTETRRFRMTVTPIHYQDARLVIAHTDITNQPEWREKHVKRLRELARLLIHAQEEERERIARDIHDDLGSRIALLSFSLHRISNQQIPGSGPQTEELGQIINGINDLAKALRNISHCLHPPLLKDAGLCAALRTLCDEFQRAQAIQVRSIIPIEMPTLPSDVALCLFRVSQECLHNVAKHANATQVDLVLDRTLHEIQLKISDNGVGFEPSEYDSKSGLGLLSIRERILSLRGRVEIRSIPGMGTRIHTAIPLPHRRPSLKVH